MFVTPKGTFNVINAEQPLKERVEMLFNPSGRAIDLSEVQFEKDPGPISSSPFGRLTELRDLQFAKAFVGM